MKEDFIRVNDRWLHKSLVARTGRSARRKMYRTLDVRVSSKDLGTCAGLVQRVLGKVWVGNLALVSKAVLVSKPFGNRETVADRIVRVLVKNCLDRGVFQSYGIVGSEVTGWGYRQCEAYLWGIVKNWVIDFDRWMNRRCSMHSKVSRVRELDSGVFELPNRDKLFVERLSGLRFYQ